jgi:PAS domain-containing protein
MFIRDITRRKQTERKIRESEELYRGLFQNVPVAIMEFDYSSFKKYCDKLRMNGVTDFQKYFFSCNSRELDICTPKLKRINDQVLCLWEFSNDRDMELLSQEKNRQVDISMRKKCRVSLAEDKTFFDYEEKIYSFKGNLKHLHTWVSVAPGCEKSFSRVYLCFVDITARKQAENELIHYKEHLEEIITERTTELQQSRQKEQELFQIERGIRKELEAQLENRVLFTRALVHELKTPLTAMLSSSEVLTEELQDDN